MISRKVYFSALSTVSNFIFQLLLLSLLSRNTDKEAFGLISVLASINTFLFIFVDFGVGTYIVTAKKISRQMLQKISNLLFCISCLISFIGIILTYAFVTDANLANGLFLTFLNIIILSIARVPRAIYQREGKFERLAMIDCMSSMLIITFLYFAFYWCFERDVDSSIILYFLPVLSLSLTTTILLRYGFAPEYTSKEFDFKFNNQFFNFNIPLFLNSLLNFSLQNLDLLIVAKFLGLAEAGGYMLLKQLVIRPVQVVSPAVTNYMLYEMSNQIRNAGDVSQPYVRGTLFIISIIFVSLLCINLYSGTIISYVFGGQWSGISEFLVVFSVYGLLRASFMPIGALLSVLNKNHIGLRYTIFQGSVLVPLLALGSYFGDLEMLLYCLTSYHIILSFVHWYFLIRPNINISYFKYHIPIFFYCSILGVLNV